MNESLFIARYCAWAPGITNNAAWQEWAAGNRAMVCTPESPEIAYTDPLFRRRLSQISRMTVEVVHDLLPIDEHTKLFFISFRGELAKQFKINRMVIEDRALMPAAFSLSVFNAPIALATMAFGLKGGYTALFPGNNAFSAGLAAAEAALCCASADQLAVVYADEAIPPEYAAIAQPDCAPFAFGLLLSKQPGNGFVPLSACAATDSPQDFLKNLLLCKDRYAAS